MNFLSKKMALGLALLSTSLWANQYGMNEPSYVTNDGQSKQMSAGYNAPAQINVKESWDVYFIGEFLYWQALQDNMELGVMTDLTPVAPEVNSTLINGSPIRLDRIYKPAFRVGAGMNLMYDDWDLRGTYTRFRSTHRASASTSDTTKAILPMQGIPYSLAQLSSIQVRSANERWRLGMDIADLELSRTYYVGKALTFRPFFGPRGTWIRQNLFAFYEAPEALQTVDVKAVSHSWAIGLKAGFDTHFILGSGFRLYGMGSGDLLYTRYTNLRTTSIFIDQINADSDRVSIVRDTMSAMRTHLELEMGFGWGCYLSCEAWHIDFAAGYSFQTFFDQNMFRHFVDDITSTSTFSQSPNGNLYIHGLRVSARLDF